MGKPTSEQLEAASRIHEDLKLQEQRDPLQDDYVGKGPERLELEAEQAKRDAENGEDPATETRRLRSEVSRLAETVEKLLKMNPNLSAEAMLEHESAADRRKAWGALLTRVRAEDDRVAILIHDHPDPRQNYPVDVGANNVKMKIPRGKRVMVPTAILEVLNNAEYRAYEPQVNKMDNPVQFAPGMEGVAYIPVCRKSYPFSILDPRFLEGVHHG